MLVAAMPIAPPDGDKYWAFHVVNDSDEPIESVIVESVDYEWGDAGSGAGIGARFGPVAARTSIEVYRETDTEVRTSLTLRVRGADGAERQIVAEVGRLYRTSGVLVPIPIVGRAGKMATLSVRAPAAGTIECDEIGVRRWLAGGLCESIRWTELVQVEIVTTDEGPLVEDVFVALHERSRTCVIPSGAAEATALIARLQALPGFDNGALIDAMATTSRARVTVWRKGE